MSIPSRNDDQQTWLLFRILFDEQDFVDIDWDAFSEGIETELREYGGTMAHPGIDSLFLFNRAIDAVVCGERLVRNITSLTRAKEGTVNARAVVYTGEVVKGTGDRIRPRSDDYGVMLSISAAALPRQILLTRVSWDMARQTQASRDRVPLDLDWRQHGLCSVRGIDEPIELFEIGKPGFNPFIPPRSQGDDHHTSGSSDKTVSDLRDDQEDATVSYPEHFIIGKVLDKVYRIDKQLGKGGMGDVYRAFHQNMNSHCAIKIPRSDLLKRPGFLQRFKQEAASLRAINHPNIITVYDIRGAEDTDARLAYISMEYVEGKSLRDFFREVDDSVTVEDVLGILKKIASGLNAAHQRGIIHRDIKPDNILVSTADLEPKIVDFGMAKGGDSNLTQEMDGGLESYALTPAFASPEQFRGDRPTSASDTYSLSATIYYIFSEELIFNAETSKALKYAHQFTQPIPLEQRNPRWPVAVGEALAKSLNKSPKERHVNTLELIDDIDKALKKYKHISYNAFMQEGKSSDVVPMASEVTEPEPQSTPEPEAPAKSSKASLVTAVICLVVLAAGGWYVVDSGMLNPTDTNDGGEVVSGGVNSDLSSEDPKEIALPVTITPSPSPTVAVTPTATTSQKEIANAVSPTVSATSSSSDQTPEATPVEVAELIEATPSPSLTPARPKPNYGQEQKYNRLTVAVKAELTSAKDERQTLALIINQLNQNNRDGGFYPSRTIALANWLEDQMRQEFQKIDTDTILSQQDWANDKFDPAIEKIEKHSERLDNVILPVLKNSRAWITAFQRAEQAKSDYLDLRKKFIRSPTESPMAAAAQQNAEAGGAALKKFNAEQAVEQFNASAKQYEDLYRNYQTIQDLSMKLHQEKDEKILQFFRSEITLDQVAPTFEKIKLGHDDIESGKLVEVVDLWSDAK